MKTTPMRLLALGLLVLLTQPLSAASPNSPEACFDSATTQRALTQCSQAASEAADAELNQVYGEVRRLYRGDKAFLDDLKRSQRAWLVFRDQELALRHPVDGGGSAQSMCRFGSLQALTEQRTAQLRRWLQPEEGDVCMRMPDVSGE